VRASLTPFSSRITRWVSTCNRQKRNIVNYTTKSDHHFLTANKSLQQKKQDTFVFDFFSELHALVVLSQQRKKNIKMNLARSLPGGSAEPAGHLGWWVGSSRYLSETSNSPTSTTHKSRH
jgi:hypothetical protein